MSAVAAHLIRHAVAGQRSRNGQDAADDDLRPLDEVGWIQAKQLAEHFEGAAIDRVLSSPAVRCQQTVAAVARSHGVEVETTTALAEGASPAAVVDLITSLPGDVVLCTHGDIIPEVIRRLAARGMATRGPVGYAKGSVWTLETDGQQVVSGTYQPF